MTDKELLDMAKEASKKAYAPYSRFSVGAALECSDGTVFTGCNIENASLGLTICAERVALGKAVSEGRRDFLRIAIYGPGQDYCMPCGSCRQVLMEFSGDLKVICGRGEGDYVNYSLPELLPRAFTFKGE